MRYAIWLWVSLLGATAAMAAPGVKLQRQFDPAGGQPTTTVGQKVKLGRSCPYRLAGEPRYRSSKPLYGVARLGTGVHNTYVFAVDESGGTGKGYDTVTLDVNNNRNLSDDKAMPLRRYGQTQAVPVAVELDGHPITLHVTAEMDGTTCSLRVLDYCRGKVSVAGKERAVALVSGDEILLEQIEMEVP
jgi:hypothetical protein